MKRVLVVWVLCSALSAGSFAMLLLEDRQLDVALPYSVPIAFFSLIVAAPLALALFEWLRGRRPIVVHVAPVPHVSRATAVDAPPGLRPRFRGAQGLVLLDCSTLPTCPSRERAA